MTAIDYDAPRRLRRAAMLVVVAVIASIGLVGVARPEAASAAGKTATPNYDELAMMVAQQINEVRLHPGAMADQLQTLVSTFDGSARIKLPDGSDIYTDLPYLKKSIAEMRQQPALPALKWSQKLAGYARSWLPYAEQYGHGGYPPAPARPVPAGVVPPIEAIAGTDTNALSQVYGHWISWSDKWQVGTAFDPSRSWNAKPGNKSNPLWRGHRGIINDQSVSVIGVGCGPHTYPWDPDRPSIRCVINDTSAADDASTIAIPSDGKAALADLAGPLSGTVGSKVGDGTRTVTADTASPSPTPSATNSNVPDVAPGVTVPSAAANGSTASATPQPSPTESASPSGAVTTPPPVTQVTLCSDVDYGGTCQTAADDIRNMTDTTIGNDRLASFKIPAGKWLSLYQDFDFAGQCQSFSGDRASLAVTRFGSGRVSSLTISATEPKNCPAAEETVTLCSDKFAGGRCIVADADVPDMSATDVGNDQLSSFRIPSGKWLSVYQDFNYAGKCQSFDSDKDTLAGTRIGDRQASSFKITTSAPADCPANS